jgi:hypothetical protein
MAECLEAGPRRPILKDDGSAVDESAGGDRPIARVFDGREHSRGTGAAGRRLLGGQRRKREDRERQRHQRQPRRGGAGARLAQK